MAWPGRITAFVGASALALAPGCRHAQGYKDPLGPAYLGVLAPEPPLRPRLRIVTFNIEYALRVDRAIVALREHPKLKDADIVTLQEMDAPGTKAIARGLGMNYVYYPASLHPKYGRDVGDAVLTPWPIERTFKVPLPHDSRGLRQSRVAAGAIVRVSGRAVRVYSIHLGSPFGASPGQRRDQVDVVLAHAREGNEPVVIAGDFNSKALGNRLVADGYVWLTEKVGKSRGFLSLDHIYVKGLPIETATAGVARDVKDASDHRPVWAELGLTAPDARGHDRAWR